MGFFQVVFRHPVWQFSSDGDVKEIKPYFNNFR